MLLAPVLAVFSALLIAVAVTMFLPLNQPDGSTQVQTSSLNGVQAVPTAAACAADLYTLPMLVMLAVAAVVLVVLVAMLFFREKNLEAT